MLAMGFRIEARSLVTETPALLGVGLLEFELK